MSSRLVVALVGCAALALIGTVAAKSPPPSAPLAPKLTKGVTLEGVDPVFAGQLSPRPLSATEAAALRNAGSVAAPKFTLKHLDPVHRLRILGADDDAVLDAPTVFDAQNLYHDADNWMIAGTARVGASVFPGENYIAFTSPDPGFAGGAGAVVRVKGVPGTRYLLECSLVASESGTTFSARSPSGEFTVSSDARATLLAVHDMNAAGPLTFDIGASSQPWYLEGCELFAYRR